MTIRLKRIELSNIRSHEKAVFEPDDTGITAIKGPTGAGKSTIVDSLPWILFGTKPPGVSRTLEIYRSGAEFPDDKCYAQAEISIDGADLRVTRKMVSKTGAVECVVEELADDGVTYTHLAGPAVSHSEEYIRKRLKMSDKGFLSAVFVQQKQVDNLISASPRERGEIIEKLTGIHGLTHSLDLARQESSTLKKAVKLSTVDENTVAELEETREEVTKDIEKLREKHITANERYDESSTKLKSNEAKIVTLRDEVSRRKNAENRLSILVPHHETMSGRIETLKERRKSLRSKMQEMSGYGNLDESREAAADASAAHSDALQELHSHKAEEDNLKKELRTSRSAIKESGYGSSDEVDEAVTKLDEQVKELRAAHEKAGASVSDVKAEGRSLRGAKKVLEEGEGTCPSCLQTVHDPVSALRTIDEQIDQAKSDLADAQEAKDKSSAELEGAKTEYDAAVKAQEAFATRSRVEASLKDTQAEVRTASSTVKLKEGAARVAEKALYSVEQASSVQDEVKSVTRELEDAIDSSSKAANEIQDLKKEKESLSSTSDETLEKHEEAISKLRERTAKLSEGIVKIEGRILVLEERLSSIDRQIESEEANVARYKSLLKNAEEAEASVSVISDFRQDRIDNSVPAIAALASNLLGRFTDGQFIDLKIDSKFRVRVTRNDGAEFNVGLLSGGELSAAAMALRLAIGMMLSFGSSKNLLILDEVLTAQDGARSEIILNTIREVCEGQVIIIAHNDSIDSIVDQIVEV